MKSREKEEDKLYDDAYSQWKSYVRHFSYAEGYNNLMAHEHEITKALNPDNEKDAIILKVTANGVDVHRKISSEQLRRVLSIVLCENL